MEVRKRRRDVVFALSEKGKRTRTALEAKCETTSSLGLGIGSGNRETEDRAIKALVTAVFDPRGVRTAYLYVPYARRLERLGLIRIEETVESGAYVSLTRSGRSAFERVRKTKSSRKHMGQRGCGNTDSVCE